MNSFYIGIAGIAGAITRYIVSMISSPLLSGSFPWGTLFCNFLGTIMLSCIAFSPSIRISEQLRSAITTGFIGSFTTFSAFSFEAFDLFRTGHPIVAVSYIMVSLWGGLAMAWLGYRLSHRLTPQRRNDL